MPAQAPAANPQAMNAAARSLILRGGMVGNTYYPPAIDMWQQLSPQLVSAPQPGSVLTFYIRNVGLVKRVICQFKATVTGGTTTTSTLTALGLANFVSNVIFTDLGNNQRINTTGWHLTGIASAKRRTPFGSAYTTDNAFGYGNNNNRIQYAPATIAATVASEIDFCLEIPFVQNDTDLRGAIYADVTQATMQVQITLNPNMFVTSTADATLAMYQSGGTDLATLSNVTMQVTQNYLDQIPRQASNGANVPILPQLDLGTAYTLYNTASGLPIVNQDNSAPFVNARTYLSSMFIYDNNGTLNVNGTDLNYINLTSANFTNVLNYNPKMLGLLDRNVLGDDFSKGMYYLDYRHRPIDTNQFGNMQLNINPSSVGGSGAVILYGWEAYSIIGLVNQGGSIPTGG